MDPEWMVSSGIYISLYIYIPAPSNRFPLVAFGDLKVAGGDLLEGAGIYITHLSKND